MLVGSAINIWYNVTNVAPMLTADQRVIFIRDSERLRSLTT